MKDYKILKKALKYATLAHKGKERRISRLPYISHPFIVSLLLKDFLSYTSKYKNKDAMIIVAILHDVLEDTSATYINLVDNFGLYIANLVLDLTNDELLIKSIGKLEYLKQKMITMEKEAFLIKLVDRLHNITDNPSFTYIVDTVELMQFLKIILKDDLNKIEFRVINLIEHKCRTFIYLMDNYENDGE